MLGVVGLVIGGIWVAASAVQQSYMISGFVKNVQITCTQAKRILPAQLMSLSPLNSWISDVAQRSGVLPSDWSSGTFFGQGIINIPFAPSGIMLRNEAGTGGWTSGWDGMIMLMAGGWPQSSCERIVRAIAPTITSNPNSIIYKMTPNINSPSTLFQAGVIPTQPIDQFTGCSANSGNNALAFICDNR